MAIWLWVDKLDPKNDWIELKSFGLAPLGNSGYRGGGARRVADHDASFTLDPGRFLTDLYRWCFNGEARTVWVFFDPQTEYEFSDSLATGVTTSANSKIITVSINFERMKVQHSGAP